MFEFTKNVEVEKVLIGNKEFMSLNTIKRYPQNDYQLFRMFCELKDFSISRENKIEKCGIILSCFLRNKFDYEFISWAFLQLLKTYDSNIVTNDLINHLNDVANSYSFYKIKSIEEVENVEVTPTPIPTISRYNVSAEDIAEFLSVEHHQCYSYYNNYNPIEDEVENEFDMEFANVIVLNPNTLMPNFENVKSYSKKGVVKGEKVVEEVVKIGDEEYEKVEITLDLSALSPKENKPNRNEVEEFDDDFFSTIFLEGDLEEFADEDEENEESTIEGDNTNKNTPITSTKKSKKKKDKSQNCDKQNAETIMGNNNEEKDTIIGPISIDSINVISSKSH